MITIKKINKKQIIEYLKNNPNCFSNKNNCQIDNVKTTHKYYLLPKCGHEIHSYLQNVIYDDGLHCPICSGRIVSRGINDLATTRPDLVRYLLNKEDAYKYTKNSNKIINWICPDCGLQWEQSVIKMNKRITKCANCNNIRSYSEKFFEKFLNQICEPYKNNVTFEWSDNKQYDFWLIEKNAIVEIHGKQHYSNSPLFVDLAKQQMIDEYKRTLALENGIKEYIIIDCRSSNPKWILSQIKKSSLPDLLYFSTKDIDWEECDLYATSHIVKKVCEDYEQGKNIKELQILYSKCHNTIQSYLKKGSKYGWCNYDPEKAKMDNYIENGKRIARTLSKQIYQIDSDDSIVATFPSVQSAQRELGISHIWDCLHSKRKTAGGYKWRYTDE